VTVRIERRAPRLAELIMDRPEALNALSTEQARRLTAAAREVAGEPRVSVMIISSALERAFCVGADLKERHGFTDDDLRAQREVFIECFGAVREMPVPTIAAVDGFALGGGFELALCCDLIVASEQAGFALPEVGLGLVPGGGGTQSVSRRAGLNRGLDLVLTGRRVPADEAYRLGLVDRLVPSGTARAAAYAVAAEIAGKSPVALRAAKQAVRRGFEADLAVGLQIEDEAWRQAAFSPDRIEGIAAFTAKRPPRWPGLAGDGTDE
jgi:enoyl-CoA hydratase/carnithine racemase